MSFDGTEAALAALMTQESSTSLSQLTEADQAGQMLEAAMLAGAGMASPTETQAIMAAPAEDAGEVLVERLMETTDARYEAATPEATDPNSDLAEYDFASVDPILPEGEDFYIENVTQQSSGQTIIVTGTRVRLYFVPSEPVSEPPVQGDTAVIEPTDPPANPDAGFYVYEIIALGLRIRMPEAEYNALNAAQKNALFQVLENHHKSADLMRALQHFKNEEVEVEIRLGTRGWDPFGGRYDFVAGELSKVSVLSSTQDGTNLHRGTTVVITFNSTHGRTADGDFFAKGLIEDILHPVVPDTKQGDGWDDHDRVIPMREKAWELIAPSGTLGGS